ncbi:MAG: ubiquinone-binding protein [Alphaproteobacteria bacterium]|nr:ubiquinone-binding protein [Alphaproteobacteria bacterium]
MLQHIEKRHVPYSQAQMFDLVASVDTYKDFAPWCVASRIKKWDGPDVFYADLVIGYKMFRERFSSKVVLERPDCIYIEYQKGPLKHLQNRWKFEDMGDNTCVIHFSVEFEFQNVFLQKLATGFFNEVVKRMVSSFENRAAELYGKADKQE